MRQSKNLLAILFCLTLAACSGGGGSSRLPSSDTGSGPDDGGGTPPVMSTDWRDYSPMFDCDLSYGGANFSFGTQYKKFAQPIAVTQTRVGAAITGIYYPSGQTVSLYDDLSGNPGNLLATATDSNYFDKTSGFGSMCCNDRTFVWYFPSFVSTTSGSTYYIVTTPINPAEYTSFKVASLQGAGCYSTQPMQCQKMDDTWETCQISGGQFNVLLQDLLY